MSDLKARFEAAVAATKTLTKRPDNATLLAIYANFKQATEGDIRGERPEMFDRVACAKFDAWEAIEGTSTEDAMAKYVVIVETLKAS
ncbi:MAG: acyl-CoA-binding protein [Hyphomicrobiaceae bacterium]